MFSILFRMKSIMRAYKELALIHHKIYYSNNLKIPKEPTYNKKWQNK